MNPAKTIREPQFKPTLPAQTQEEIIRQITGDPNCRRSGCHGKGYVGVRINPDASWTVMMCECGRFGENDYVKLSGQVRGAQETLERLGYYFITKLDEVEGKTLRATLTRWRAAIASKLLPAKPAQPKPQAVPVQGEVKS